MSPRLFSLIATAFPIVFSIGSAEAGDRVQHCHRLSALYHSALPKGATPDRMVTEATAECGAHPTGAIVFLEKGLRTLRVPIPPG